MLHHRVTHVVAQSICVPQVVIQQPLHPLGPRFPGGLSQSPAVLTLRLAQQSPQVGHHPSPRLHPPEAPCEPRHEVTQRTCPPVSHLFQHEEVNDVARATSRSVVAVLRGIRYRPRIESRIGVQTDQRAISADSQLQGVFKGRTELPNPTHTSSNHPPSSLDEYA